MTSNSIVMVACDLASKIRVLNPGSYICVQDIGTEYVINTGYSSIGKLVLPAGHTVDYFNGVYPSIEHNGFHIPCLDTFQVMAQ